jgi:hypothetical protein
MKLYKTLVRVLAAAATFAVVMLPTAAAAQVKPEDAAKFLGGWVIGVESPQGNMTMNLTIKNDAGKVAGSITSDIAPDPAAITDVAKAGEALVLKYTLDFQGMPIPAKITMTPAGDKMTVEFDVADGAFTMPGTATKK